MKKRRLGFKSLYARLLTVFLGLWWGLNAVIIGVMMLVITPTRFQTLFTVVRQVGGKFRGFITYTIFAFAGSLIFGSIVIILVVRNIVKPVRTIADAASKVAKGDFDVTVEVKRKDELGLLADGFNTMTKELKSVDAQRSTFVSSVSHEFRTPITSIKGYAELLREDAAQVKTLDDAKKLQYCDIITSESSRLIALSSDLLRLSELDNQVIREESARFSLDEQIRKTVVMLEPLWSKKDIEFDFNLEEVEYSGDKSLLERVWINLIQNAVKFSPETGVIALRLRKEQGNIIAEVEDHGAGIAAADQEHIFESFYKVSKSRSSEGNGLGLAIVKRIVEIEQGSIRIESAPGNGAKFIVTLPDLN